MRLFLFLRFPARFLSGFCTRGCSLSSPATHFVTEYSLDPFPPSLSKLLPLRSPGTSWLPNLAELDLNFLVLIFHGTPDCVDGGDLTLFSKCVFLRLPDTRLWFP